MSVAKPVIEYAKTIKTQAELKRSVATFRRLLKYHKPYVHIIILVSFLCILRSYLFALEPIYTSQILDEVIILGKQDLLLDLVLRIVFSVLGVGLLNFVIAYIQGCFSQMIARDLRTDFYSSLQKKSFKFFDTMPVGDLVSRSTMDLQVVSDFLRQWISIVSNAVFTIIIVFSFMFSVSPVMSLLAILPMIPIFYFTTQLWIKTMPLFRKMMLLLGRLGAYVQQNVIGMKVVRIFQREQEMEEGFKQVEEIYVNTAITAGKIQSKYMPSAQAILTLGITTVYVYAGLLIASPETTFTIGTLALFVRYMMRLSFPLRDLSMLSGSWVNASAGLDRVYEIIDAPVEIQDQPYGKEYVIEKGKIEFRNVTFGYVKDRPVLKNLNFTVQPGEKIAILGATGSGKTSLVFIIPRFYEIDSGEILIDGINIKSFKLSSLRNQIGLVLQDVFIFSGTIKDNIAFGKPDATMNEVITAAKQAKIHDFIISLPEGYNTIVGERGITLSGGQRQRLTIARALLTNPRILILDDSLSFVDAKTEQEIQAAIEEAMKGRTCFIIAQRLSTIKNADKIMVLDNGEIVEFGTHEELMAKRKIYSKIYQTQFLEKAPEEILDADG
ncbi:ABC transporter ATP-binding protein [Candidatus Bathyarchaeota archaeon]|nr:ABC transporter ATP-binding protein [Candidatus Bathyarchaeota archaeon]